MAAILRWFDVSGRRHRVYFRQTSSGSRELVVAGPGLKRSLGDVQVATLEDLAERDLSDLVDRARQSAADTESRH